MCRHYRQLGLALRCTCLACTAGLSSLSSAQKNVYIHCSLTLWQFSGRHGMGVHAVVVATPSKVRMQSRMVPHSRHRSFPLLPLCCLQHIDSSYMQRRRRRGSRLSDASLTTMTTRSGGSQHKPPAVNWLDLRSAMTYHLTYHSTLALHVNHLILLHCYLFCVFLACACVGGWRGSSTGAAAATGSVAFLITGYVVPQ